MESAAPAEVDALPATQDSGLSSARRLRHGWYADDGKGFASGQDLDVVLDRLLGCMGGCGAGKCKILCRVATADELSIPSKPACRLQHTAFARMHARVTDGAVVLGAFIAPPAAKKAVLAAKVQGWADTLENLSNLGRGQPYLLLTAVKLSVLQNLMPTSLQRCMQTTAAEEFEPVEEAFKESVLPQVAPRCTKDGAHVDSRAVRAHADRAHAVRVTRRPQRASTCTSASRPSSTVTPHACGSCAARTTP